MIIPLINGAGLLLGGAVNCLCCNTTPTPGLDILMASATSAGGDKRCLMGAVVKTFHNPPPYSLPPGTYQLRVDFTTGDPFYHKSCYYELNLIFSPATAIIDWALYKSGTVGNPWLVTDSGRTLRFSVEDSADCGGTNDKVQTGTALATITVASTTSMGFDFDGIAELELTGYENISFYLRSL
jgi:hypothetical protein